jgi:hypothetical protein
MPRRIRRKKTTKRKKVQKNRRKKPARRKSPRLKRVVSRNTGLKKKKRKKVQGSRGLLRKIMILVLLGSGGWYAMEKGYARNIKDKISKEFSIGKIKEKAEKQTSVQEKKTEKAEKSSLTGFIKKKVVEPIAVVRLDRLYGIGRDMVVIPLKERTFLDLPILTGIKNKAIRIGDTLQEAELAIKVLETANNTYTGLSRRVSEVLVDGRDLVELVFTDLKLKAQLGSRNINLQLENLSTLLSYPKMLKEGVINMRYGNIAFLKEED